MSDRRAGWGSRPWRRARRALERHQVALYLAAIAAGFAVGALVPGAHRLELGINVAIALLLYVTFLGIPLTRLRRAFRDGRFLVALLVVNFVVVPVVVFGLSRVVAHDDALLVGVLLVLLTPCIDYVIVFTALAGGAHERLLAATPLLMIVQLMLLPGYLLLFAGPATLAIIDVTPFIAAFVGLIVIPLAAAALTQAIMRRMPSARAIASAGEASMVPLMMLVLFLVVASQARVVIERRDSVAVVIPIYAAFLVIMAGIGVLSARLARLDVAGARALTFSGATRNSLVVLPLALALPASLALAPAVVVTQTLVELVGMIVYVRVIPLLIPVTRRPRAVTRRMCAGARRRGRVERRTDGGTPG